MRCPLGVPGPAGRTLEHLLLRSSGPTPRLTLLPGPPSPTAASAECWSLSHCDCARALTGMWPGVPPGSHPCLTTTPSLFLLPSLPYQSLPQWLLGLPSGDRVWERLWPWPGAGMETGSGSLGVLAASRGCAARPSPRPSVPASGAASDNSGPIIRWAGAGPPQDVLAGLPAAQSGRLLPVYSLVLIFKVTLTLYG